MMYGLGTKAAGAKPAGNIPVSKNTLNTTAAPPRPPLLLPGQHQTQAGFVFSGWVCVFKFFTGGFLQGGNERRVLMGKGEIWH